MATYLKNENICRSLIRKFISREIKAGYFSAKYIRQWGIDRDKQYAEVNNGANVSKEEMELCEDLDQIFTACDCYEPKPKEDIEIDEEQLWKEVRQVLVKRRGEI